MHSKFVLHIKKRKSETETDFTPVFHNLNSIIFE